MKTFQSLLLSLRELVSTIVSKILHNLVAHYQFSSPSTLPLFTYANHNYLLAISYLYHECSYFKDFVPAILSSSKLLGAYVRVANPPHLSHVFLQCHLPSKVLCNSLFKINPLHPTPPPAILIPISCPIFLLSSFHQLLLA